MFWPGEGGAPAVSGRFAHPAGLRARARLIAQAGAIASGTINPIATNPHSMSDRN